MGVEKPVVILGFNAIDLPCLVVANAPLRRKRVESIPFKVFQHMTLRVNFGSEWYWPKAGDTRYSQPKDGRRGPRQFYWKITTNFFLADRRYNRDTGGEI